MVRRYGSGTRTRAKIIAGLELMFFQKRSKLTVALNSWNEAQAAMLYKFASVEHIKGLHRLVTQLIDGEIDPLLVLTKEQNRDIFFVDERWGARNTSANWSTNAWPFLKDLQVC